MNSTTRMARMISPPVLGDHAGESEREQSLVISER